jgi:transcriptional regulator with XRE-family HTH domain
MPAPTRPPAFPELSATIARQGLTLAALSHLVGCHAGYISQIIRGHAVPSAQLRERIATALDAPESELFGGAA